jgi:hypothetical protein
MSGNTLDNVALIQNPAGTIQITATTGGLVDGNISLLADVTILLENTGSNSLTMTGGVAPTMDMLGAGTLSIASSGAMAINGDSTLDINANLGGGTDALNITNTAGDITLTAGGVANIQGNQLYIQSGTLNGEIVGVGGGLDIRTIADGLGASASLGIYASKNLSLNANTVIGGGFGMDLNTNGGDLTVLANNSYFGTGGIYTNIQPAVIELIDGAGTQRIY